MRSRGEDFSLLIEHLRLAQEDAANISHHDMLQGDTVTGKQWLVVQEQLKAMQHIVTKLAMSRAQ